jgi:hypothetical protein
LAEVIDLFEPGAHEKQLVEQQECVHGICQRLKGEKYLEEVSSDGKEALHPRELEVQEECSEEALVLLSQERQTTGRMEGSSTREERAGIGGLVVIETSPNQIRCPLHLAEASKQVSHVEQGIQVRGMH